MNRKAIILMLVGLLTLCGTGSAKRLYVPGQYATIQAGIDAAVDGDTVIVADGTYTGEGNRDIDFKGKAITVRSENGPEYCVIDCNGTEDERHRGFRFGNNEDANSVLDGFTIINGYAPDELLINNWHPLGGAIFCSSSSPTVSNCVIRGNTARGGAGICCKDSTAAFNNCTVSMNYGIGLAGGGIQWFDSNSTISNCTVNGNEGGGIGGSGDPVITDCTISYNKGPGIGCGRGNPKIANCTIIFNKGEEYGGGISVSHGNATITDCNISYNTNPEWDLGGIRLWWLSSATIARCTIVGNSTFFGGGGIYCEESSNITINDCVITGNYAQFGADGIDCEYSEAAVTNCVISSNLGNGVGVYDHSKAVINNCRISMNVGTGISGWWYSNATIMDCIISGNAGYTAGGVRWYRGRGTATIANCTIVGNTTVRGSSGGIYCSDSELNITNCVLRDNRPEEITMESGTILATYNDVQEGWPGVGNIDAEPWFVEAGYWDANGTPGDANDDFWVEGDYRLLEGSPCIDSGDPNYQPEPNETDLDGNPRLVDGDEDGLAVVDMGAYEYLPAVEVGMTLVPRTVNCRSKGKSIKARITLTEGFSAENVDVDEPAVAEPMGVESEYMKVVGRSEGPVMLEVGFKRGSFCEALSETGEVEVTVVGWLADGREFYGTDTIRIRTGIKERRRVRQVKKLGTGLRLGDGQKRK